ncbi:cytochrome P450 [Hyphobacterium sp.]|uniref:cytochrome P450 n=1 Tax=Hyphobacterium sp. TaxID=2004662 RepID=UPI0037495628
MTAETDFIPPMPERQRQPLGLLGTARVLRHSPVEILPQEAFQFTRISAPFLGRTVHTLSGPEEMKAVLHDDPDAWRKSPLIQRMLRPILGEAILTAHGDWWKMQRKAMQPGFVRQRIMNLVPAMSESAAFAAKSIADQPKGEDITPALNRAALSVIERALFTEANDFDRGQIRSAIELVFSETGRTRFSDLLPLPETTPRILGPKALKARKILREAVGAEIAARRKSGQTREDLLQLMLDARTEAGEAALTDTDIRDNVLSLVIAGHETTAIAIGWALYILACRPDWQDRVRAEAKAVSSGSFAADDVASLVFTRQIIDETLRLYPPAPLVGRQAIRDTQICERSVKKGDVAIIAFYALHRHHRYWDNADAFDPERFNRDNRPSDPWLFKPFGGGPRACVGSVFALTEAVVILATLVRDLKFSVPDGFVPRPVMTVTLRPEDGLPLRVEAA